MRLPNYEVVRETDDCLLLRDVGPWDAFPTITNAAEELVAHLKPLRPGQRLEYIDSYGQRDQILVRDGRFIGFALTGDMP